LEIVTIASLVLFGWLSTSTATYAASASCTKDCRDYQRVCLKAHSQASCKSEYEICMRHCKATNARGVTAG